MTDNARAVSEAVSHLLELGHTRIAQPTAIFAANGQLAERPAFELGRRAALLLLPRGGDRAGPNLTSASWR